MMVVLEAREDAGERAQGHKIMVCATTSLIDRSNLSQNDKVAIDDTKDSQTRIRAWAQGARTSIGSGRSPCSRQQGHAKGCCNPLESFWQDIEATRLQETPIDRFWALP